uniref:Putative secreted protein n=1 Tax=Amblyomma cajennense TaxID=34607 RepID=A0A023FDI8_AMBCJ
MPIARSLTVLALLERANALPLSKVTGCESLLVLFTASTSVRNFQNRHPHMWKARAAISPATTRPSSNSSALELSAARWRNAHTTRIVCKTKKEIEQNKKVPTSLTA